MTDIIDEILKFGEPIFQYVDKYWWVLVILPFVVILLFVVSKFNLFGFGGILGI